LSGICAAPGRRCGSLRGQALLLQWLPGSDVKLCLPGPQGFMRSVWQSLAALGVPGSQVRCACFGPARALARA